MFSLILFVYQRQINKVNCVNASNSPYFTLMTSRPYYIYCCHLVQLVDQLADLINQLKLIKQIAIPPKVTNHAFVHNQ